MDVVKKCDICEDKQHAYQCKGCGKDDSDLILLCETCHHAIHRGRLSSHMVEKAAGQEIRDFFTNLGTFKSKSSELQRRLDELRNSRRDIIQYTQIHESHIKEVATKLQQKIKSQAAQLLAQVQQVSAEKAEKLTQCEELCRNVIAEHQALCQEADEILGNPDDSLQDKTQKITQFQGKLQVPRLTDLETMFPDPHIQLVCDVSAVLTAIREWQLTPAPPEDISNLLAADSIKACSTLQVEKGGELSVCVESRMSANGIFYVREELDVPKRERLSALSLHFRKQGVMGELQDWTGGEGCLCAVRHPGDNRWYRGLVEELRKDRAAVRLLDYGTVETVPVASLAQLPADLPQLPFLIVACTFFEDRTVEVPREARWLFSDLASHKKVTCTFKTEMPTDNLVPLWKVDLHDVERDINIAERVIAAVKDKETKAEKVSCRDIRLKEPVAGTLTIIQANAAAQNSSQPPNKTDSQLKTSLNGAAEGLSVCSEEEAVSTTPPLPKEEEELQEDCLSQRSETKTEPDSPSVAEEANSLSEPTSVQDTTEAGHVSDKEAETSDDYDEVVLSTTMSQPSQEDNVLPETTMSLGQGKQDSVTDVTSGTAPRILKRGEPYPTLQPTSETGDLKSVPDRSSSSQRNGAYKETGPAASRQFQRAPRRDDNLSSMTSVSATLQRLVGEYRNPPSLTPPSHWENMQHAPRGDRHGSRRTPSPLSPRTMYPPPGIPLRNPPATHLQGPHHFVPIENMPLARDMPPTYQGNMYPWLDTIIPPCGQVGPYPGMSNKTGAALPLPTMVAPKMTPVSQDFGYGGGRDRWLPEDASHMSVLTPITLPDTKKNPNTCPSVSNGGSHLDKSNTTDSSVSCESAPQGGADVNSVDSVNESTIPTGNKELFTASSDGIHVPDGDQTSVPSVENNEGAQTGHSFCASTKQELCTTEIVRGFVEDTVAAVCLSAMDTSSIEDKPESSQHSGCNTQLPSGMEPTEFKLEEFSKHEPSMSGIPNQPDITVPDKQKVECPPTFVVPASGPDPTSAAMSMLYGSSAAEVSLTWSVNLDMPTATASVAGIDPQSQTSVTDGTLQQGNQHAPEHDALESGPVDSVAQGEGVSAPASDSEENVSPLVTNTVLEEGELDNSWASANDAPCLLEDTKEQGLPTEIAVGCNSSMGCAGNDITDTKCQPTFSSTANLDKPGETLSMECAKMQDCFTATCCTESVTEGGFTTKGEETSSNLNFCKSMSGAACASTNVPYASKENQDDLGSEPMAQVTVDHPIIGTAVHMSHHEDPPSSPSSAEVPESLSLAAWPQMKENDDKPALEAAPRDLDSVKSPVQKAKVIHPMEPDGSFWIQYDHTEALEEEYARMKEEIDAEAALMEPLKEESCRLGLLVSAVSPKEGTWYRGQIEKKFRKTALVRFVDHGNVEEVSYGDIKPLPDKFHHFNFKVHRSWLVGMNTYTGLSEKQVQLFNRLTANMKDVWVQLTGVLPAGAHIVHLWDVTSYAEDSINQQVFSTEKGLPMTADPNSFISIVQRSMPIVIAVGDSLSHVCDTSGYHQRGRGNMALPLHAPGFQHGQLHTSPPRDTPAYLGATNMESIPRPQSAPPGPQSYVPVTCPIPGRRRWGSGDKASSPGHQMGSQPPLTFKTQELPIGSQSSQQKKEHPGSQKEQPRHHPCPKTEKQRRSEQHHTERRPSQKPYIPPQKREDWAQKQQQAIPNSHQHKQPHPPNQERPTPHLGAPCPTDLSTVDEHSQVSCQLAAEDKVTSGSEDWDDAIEDWTEDSVKSKECDKLYTGEQQGTGEETDVIKATQLQKFISYSDTDCTRTSVSGSSSPARSVQSAPSTFDEDDWVEGEDPLSQRSDLGSLEGSQPFPQQQKSFNMQLGHMQSGHMQSDMETNSHGRNNGQSRLNCPNRLACHHCGQNGHFHRDCPSLNKGKREKKNGRKGGGGRRNNRW